jgi:hypothetical protein
MIQNAPMHGSQHQHHALNLRITKLLIHDTGTYNSQWRRPFHTEPSPTALSSFQERLQYAPKIAPSMLAGVANQFLTPMAQPEKQISIPNGWNERRLRFVMEVEIEHLGGMGRSVEMIMGYTDHPGVSLNGHLDEHMQFFVNSVMHVKTLPERTPSGVIARSNVTDSSHVLADNHFDNIYSSKEQRMRPEDLYATMTRTHLQGLGDIVDGRSTMTNVAVKSRRSNGMAAHYMANVIQAYQMASATQQLGQGDFAIMSQARGLVGENLASRDPFLSGMSQVQGMSVGNVFTYKDLQRLDPGVPHVTRYTTMQGVQQVQEVHQVGQTADWGAATRETVVATILSQAVPGILMDLGLTVAAFKATNLDIGAQIHTLIMNLESFSQGVDLTPQMQMFVARLEHEVLRDISYDNQVGFMIQMNIDLFGETWIKISLDGGPCIDFVTPSFCDALLVPVITGNQDLSVQVASDIEMLVNSVADNLALPNTAGGSAFGTI